MKVILPLLLTFFTPLVFGGSLIITTHQGSPPVASHLVVKADFVAVPITISSDEDEPGDRINLIQKTKGLVASSLKSKGLKLEPGIASLSPSKNDSFSFKSYSRDSSVKFYALGEITDDTSIFSQVIEIHKALKDIKMPGDVSIRLGLTSLGLYDPEKYRKELLQLVKSQVDSDSNSLGLSGAIEISGLENPVSIIQKDDTQVGLYIDYAVKVTK